jgi:copper/silver efflux system protein
MFLYLKLTYQKRKAKDKLQTTSDFEKVVIDGASKRIRPKLMTVLTLMISWRPAFWSKRITASMVGGFLTPFLRCLSCHFLFLEEKLYIYFLIFNL